MAGTLVSGVWNVKTQPAAPPRSEPEAGTAALCIVTNPKLAYLRLHGRNAKGYITGKSVAEQFDYRYSDDELEAIAQRAVTLAAKAAAIHVVYNNNASDYPLRNAATFQQLLARKYPEATAGDHHSQPTPVPRLAGQILEFDFAAAQEPEAKAGARPGTGKRR